jgi:biotin transport system substrate-specific component
MLAAAGVMGTLADRGWTHSFYRTWFAAFLGSLITFSFGLLVLSFFVPRQSVLTAGLFPFLPGDFIKTGLASFMASQCTHLTEKIE